MLPDEPQRQRFRPEPTRGTRMTAGPGRPRPAGTTRRAGALFQNARPERGPGFPGGAGRCTALAESAERLPAAPAAPPGTGVATERKFVRDQFQRADRFLPAGGRSRGSIPACSGGDLRTLTTLPAVKVRPVVVHEGRGADAGRANGVETLQSAITGTPSCARSRPARTAVTYGARVGLFGLTMTMAPGAIGHHGRPPAADGSISHRFLELPGPK